MDISVVCMTYNHEKYIRKTIDGFLMQKGDFEYEIIIHDDASTDGTVEILKEYKKKYPQKIELILQKKNRYSKEKGIQIFKTYILPLVKGKYIALCEGDDFWIYDRKLEKQFKLMEENDNISLCYHNALIYQKRCDLLRLNVNNHPSGYIEKCDVINVTKGWYPTASFFGRSDYIREVPSFSCIPTGDEVWRTCMACRGDLYYFNRAWSVYREFTVEGWNTRYYQDKELAKKHFRDTVEYFKEFNFYSEERFEKYIKERLFHGVDKYRDAHYGMDCLVVELKRCLNDLKITTKHEIDNILDEYYSIYAIRCKDYYRFTIEKLLKRGKGRLYLYGVGNEAIKALIELDKHDMTPKGFIITNKARNPSKLMGVPVYRVDEFIFDENKIIWPCLINGREEVLKILSNKECKNIVI